MNPFLKVILAILGLGAVVGGYFAVHHFLTKDMKHTVAPKHIVGSGPMMTMTGRPNA